MKQLRKLRLHRCLSSKRVWVLITTIILSLTLTRLSHAAQEEIQVYLDDKEDLGKLSVDLHNNWVPSGNNQPDFHGGEPSKSMYRLTPEFNYGLTKNLELGAYLLSNYHKGYYSGFDGGKVRIKYIAPHDSQAGAFWGLNLEIGRTNLTTTPIPWNGELKGISGWRGDGWTVGANLNIDSALSPHAGETKADVDFKIMRQVVGDTNLGIESYNDLGPLSKISSLNENSKTLYAVIDTKVFGSDLNIGIGHGLNDSSDHLIFKFIINFKLN